MTWFPAGVLGAIGDVVASTDVEVLNGFAELSNSRVDLDTGETLPFAGGNVSAGTNRVVVVLILHRTATVVLPTAMDFEGEAMTRITSQVLVGGQDLGVDAWFINDAGIVSAGSGPSITSSGGSGDTTNFRAFVGSFQNVAQVNPVSDLETDVVASPAIADLAALENVDGGRFVGAWIADKFQAPDVNASWTNATETLEDNGAASAYFSIAEEDTTGTNIDITIASSGIDTDFRNGLIGFTLRPPAADTVNTFTADGTFVVPNGVISITGKAWGAGGGGGGGGNVSAGGAGGGGGFVEATVSVTPGETLNVTVGGGGGGGPDGTAGAGGGGGGRTFLERDTGSVNLLEAGAGGGGGGGDNSGGTPTGGRGGAGGGSTGEDGVDIGTSTGGDGGTQLAGGAAGVGQAGPADAGGAGAGGNGRDDGGPTGGGGAAGASGGGEGGDTNNLAGGGGGGGAGFFGGGGGGEAQGTVGSGTGGGGGSNLAAGTSTNTQGSAQTGAGQGDSNYPANTGDGGNGGTVGGAGGDAGERGAIVIIAP